MLKDPSTLSEEEIDEILSSASQGNSLPDPSTLSEEQIDSMLAQQAPSPSGMTPELPSQGVSEGQGVMPYLAALLSGGQRGVGELGSGALGMAAQGVDKLAGTNLQQQVPQYQLQGIDQEIAQAHPTTANIGEFAAKAAPMFAAPELGGGLAGQMAGQAAVGGLEGAIESPDERLKGLLTGTAAGALGPVIGKGAGYALGAGKKATQKALSELLGGTKTPKQIERSMKALKNIGSDDSMPIGPIIGSPHMIAAHGGLSAIPGSRQARNFVDIGKDIKNAVTDSLGMLKPKDSVENVSEALVKDITKKRGDVLKISGGKYKDLYRLADKADSNVRTLDISKATKELDSKLKTNKSYRKYSDDGDIEQIMDDLHNKSEISFKDAFEVRSSVNDALRNTPHDDRRKIGLLTDIKKTIDSDTKRSAYDSGNDNIINAFNDAQEHYIKEVVPLNKKDVTKFTNLGEDVDKFIPTFIKGSAIERGNLIESVSKHLSKENKSKFAHELLTKSAREVLGETEINEGKILNEYAKLGNRTKKSLFPKDVREKLDSALLVKKMTNLDLNQLLNYKTGKSVAKAAAWAGSIGTSGGLPVAANLATKLLKSPALRSSYIKALESGKIAPVEKNVKQLAKLTAPSYLASKSKSKDKRNGR